MSRLAFEFIIIYGMLVYMIVAIPVLIFLGGLIWKMWRDEK